MYTHAHTDAYNAHTRTHTKTFLIYMYTVDLYLFRMARATKCHLTCYLTLITSVREAPGADSAFVDRKPFDPTSSVDDLLHTLTYLLFIGINMDIPTLKDVLYFRDSI